MTDNSKRVSELAQTANAAQSDRVVILKSPSLNASLRTITIANLTSSMTKATYLTPGVVRVGQGISVDSNGTISSSGSAAVGVVNVNVNGQNTYNVGASDSIIFVNPVVVGSNVTITLPIATAIEGKEIIVKLIDADGDYKVTITTDDHNNAYLEDPITGAFDYSYNLVQTGQAETWIHDGNVYRHLSTARATPIFHTGANNYAQIAVINSSNGQNASADLALYNDLGDYEAGTGPFIDIGIESSTYSNSLYGLYGHNDGYVYVDGAASGGGNLIVGTAQDKSIIMHAGGTNANNRVMTINSGGIDTFVKYNNRYTQAYHTTYNWAVYTEDDETGAHPAWAYIDLGLPDTNSPYVIIENQRGDTGENYHWSFDANGVLNLPGNGGDIKRNGVSVIGTGQIDGGNAFTSPTAEITVDGGGA